MLYKKEFGNNFNLGFQLTHYPFLTDKSWHNDICPSFYFKYHNQYAVLWIEHLNLKDREEENCRYTITSATNEGDEQHLEIYSGNGDVIFESERLDKLIIFFELVNNSV